jgi:Asp-tRNA(Asn)/Glu-tRNA(Gln) amidotransferase A subunit family amidase
MADDIAFIPATRLLALYRSRQLSPVEVIEHTLRRLETYESAINAFVLYDPETGLAMSRASEARWQKSEPQGLLDGVPVALKDTLLTRGWPRLLGSRTIDPNQAWDEDAPVPGRLRAEGAVFFGKTTTPEFGWKGDNRLAAERRHPQPVEPGADPRRQQWGQRRRGFGRHRSSCGRHRRRRLDPYPRRILRYRRP